MTTPIKPSAFYMCAGFTLLLEGGESNDPFDPGGYTKFGICSRSHPTVDIRHLDEAGALAIYKKDYWDPCNCDDMHRALALCVFDSAINMGVGQANRLRRDVLPIPTMRATVEAFCDRRLETYKTFRDFHRYKNHWIERNERCRALALALLPAGGKL